MTSKKGISKRDASRNIGEELLQAIRDIKGGKVGAKYRVDSNYIVSARLNAGLSQTQFAEVLDISPRTLQQWEQGRRSPTGAAATLIKIVSRHPEVLRDLAKVA